MSQTRMDLDEEQTRCPLLDLPPEITYSIPRMAHPDNDHLSIEATRVMATLSGACQTRYQFFKPELDKRGAKQLLTYVLQGNKAAIGAAVKIAQTNPRLFFIKSTAMDYAMDLAGNRRIIKDWSPYQALFGTGNKALLLAVKPSLDAYLETLPNGFDLATNQEQEKFPNGLDFPPCTDEFNQLVNELEAAITGDPQLRQNWKNPTPATLDLLAKFRSYYKPGIIQVGHYFNMNDLIKMHEIYDKNWSPWSADQLSFFAVCMVGFQERLMTAPYLNAVCTGLNNHITKNQPLQDNFEVINRATNKKVTVVPLTSEDLSFRLGEDYVIDNSDGDPVRSGWIVSSWRRDLVRKLCQANTAELSRLMYTPKKQTVFRCVIV